MPNKTTRLNKISKLNKTKKVNNFYLDVFNKLLTINDYKIFIVFDKYENIWFKLKNLLAALGYKNPRQAIKDLKINQKYMKKIEELYGGIILFFFL